MRKVIITRTSYLIPPKDLRSHRNIQECWQLPRGYTLLSVNDPVFSDGKTLYAPSNSKAAAIVVEGSLFTPFYQRVRSLADILTLKVATKTVLYHLVTTSRTLLEWPRLALVADWENAEQIQIVCHYPQRSLPEIGLLDTVFRE
ncbi:MAG TPA: hypothetical protein VI685_23045 [Candidatus Angelobacter sp.]